MVQHFTYAYQQAGVNGGAGKNRIGITARAADLFGKGRNAEPAGALHFLYLFANVYHWCTKLISNDVHLGKKRDK